MTEKILELKTAQDMVESDLKRYFIEVKIEDQEGNIKTSRYSKRNVSDDYAIFKGNELPEAEEIVKFYETLFAETIKKAVKATIKEDKNMDPFADMTSLLDKTTGAYYSVNDTYIHHLLIRYVALNRLIQEGVINADNYLEVLNNSFNWDNYNGIASLYDFEKEKGYSSLQQDMTFEDFKEFAARTTFDHYGGYFSLPEKYFSLVDEMIEHDFVLFGSTEPHFYKQLSSIAG